MEADRRAEVWAKTGGRCWYCGAQTSPWKDFHVEHSIPRSKGGTDDLANLVPSCQPCNNRKNNKDIEEFRAYLQTKAEHRFWFEHAKMQMVIAQQTVEEDEEVGPTDEFTPDAEELWFYLSWCFRGIGYGGSFVLTTIALLQQCTFWDCTEDGDIHCGGMFHLGEFSVDTGQSTTTLLAHLLHLHSMQVLDLKQGNECYSYNFFIMKYIALWRKAFDNSRKK